MSASYEVLIDGKIVFEFIVAFDIDAGWVDYYETDDVGGIVIVDDLPVVSRRTGSVSIDWYLEGPAAAEAGLILPAPNP